MEKVMLITASSRGIGAATARLAAAEGYQVVVNYFNNPVKADNLVQEIRENGGKAIALQADLSNEQQLIDLFAQIDHKFGRLDVLINNLGVLETQQKLEAITLDRLQRVFNHNVFSAFLACREAVKRMSTAHGGNGGAIVNVSSAASRLGAPFEYIDYAASKGAMDSLTIGLSKEVAKEGIRVNAVRPGLIYTEIHASGGEADRVDRIGPNLPLGRGGNPEEVAQAILWLACDKSSYATGSFIDVAGGV